MNYYIDAILFAFCMGCLFWYVYKRRVNLRNYNLWKHILLDSNLSFPEIEGVIRQLYNHKLIICVGKAAGSVYFRDKPTIFSWGNTYVIKQADGVQGLTLYYRGSMLKYNVDKTNLSATLFSLGGNSDTQQ